MEVSPSSGKSRITLVPLLASLPVLTRCFTTTSGCYFSSTTDSSTPGAQLSTRNLARVPGPALELHSHCHSAVFPIATALLDPLAAQPAPIPFLPQLHPWPVSPLAHHASCLYITVRLGHRFWVPAQGTGAAPPPLN